MNETKGKRIQKKRKEIKLKEKKDIEKKAELITDGMKLKE